MGWKEASSVGTACMSEICKDEDSKAEFAPVSRIALHQAASTIQEVRQSLS